MRPTDHPLPCLPPPYPPLPPSLPCSWRTVPHLPAFEEDPTVHSLTTHLVCSTDSDYLPVAVAMCVVPGPSPMPALALCVFFPPPPHPLCPTYTPLPPPTTFLPTPPYLIPMPFREEEPVPLPLYIITFPPHLPDIPCLIIVGDITYFFHLPYIL